MHENRLVRPGRRERGKGRTRPHAVQRFHANAQRRHDRRRKRPAQHIVNRRRRRRNPSPATIRPKRSEIGTVPRIRMPAMQPSDNMHPVLVWLQSLHGLFKRQAVERTALLVQVLGNAGQRVEPVVLQKENDPLRNARRLNHRYVRTLHTPGKQARPKQRTRAAHGPMKHFSARNHDGIVVSWFAGKLISPSSATPWSARP